MILKTTKQLLDLFYKYAKAVNKNIQNLIDVKQFDLKIDSNKSTIFLNKEVAQKLKEAEGDLPHGWKFLIKHGYRSYDEQKKIIETEERALKIKHPENWKELLIKYTGGYEDLEQDIISHMNHRSGNAVDLSIEDNGKEIDLGGTEAAMNNKDHLDYFENKKNLTSKDAVIKKNRQILKRVLLKHGFEPWKEEWWHWGYKSKIK
jgi:D-alanyl-D-alanine dipeptidase